MQNLKRDTLIKTKMDPKDFRANYPTIKVRDCGEDRSFESTATTEIFHDDYDPETKLFTIGVALHYPRRTGGIKMTIAKAAGTINGKLTAIPADCYILTQEDFDAVIAGKVIDVPACY
jgi:hypothetical protein